MSEGSEVREQYMSNGCTCTYSVNMIIIIVIMLVYRPLGLGWIVACTCTTVYVKALWLKLCKEVNIVYVYCVHCASLISGYLPFSSEYLMLESRDKRKIEYDTSDWTLECCKVSSSGCGHVPLPRPFHT